MRRDDYAALGGHMAEIRPVESLTRSASSSTEWRADNPWPLATAAECGMSGIQAALLPDGRLHLQHGPIDLIIGAFGEAARSRAARRRARVLRRRAGNLVAEAAGAAHRAGHGTAPLAGSLSRGAILASCWPYRAGSSTPMAAVAGAVADHVLAAITAAATLERAYVNDGGDIAFHLAPARR